MSDSSTVVSRSVVRTVVVALLALFVVASTVPGLSMLWDSTDVSYGPQGPLGFSTDYDGVVKAVDPGSPAAQAGIRDGDRVDLKRTPFEDRHYLAAAPARVPAGKSVTIWVKSGSSERPLALTAEPGDYPPAAKVNLFTRTLAALIFILVGGLLVLLRPSLMTWGFYFYCLGFSPGIAFGGFSRFPSAIAQTVYLLLTDILTAAGTVGILIFSLLFLSDDPPRWRRLLLRSTPYLLAAFALLIVYPDFANLLLGVPAENAQRVMLALQGVAFFLSVIAVLQTYLHGRIDNRPRIQWVVVGLLIGVIATYLGSVLLFSSELPFNPPRWLQSSLLTLNVMLPLTVAYAVIRHRVFEVSFVVSRALIYAVLTAAMLSVFGLIDWFIGQQLAAARLASLVEIGAAIALSFWLNSLEKRVEGAVDSVFFRKRRQAMRRLERAADAVHNASATQTVDDFLTREPVEALSLSSAALFRRLDDGSFQRVLASGWPTTSLANIAHDDPLPLNLGTDCLPLRLAEIGWQHAALPQGFAVPILAVPLVARQIVLGFVLYGAHANGAEIDPEEVKSLNHLARAAQATYDHLKVVELDSQISALKVQLAALSMTSGQASSG
jgi:hypothetical protein